VRACGVDVRSDRSGIHTTIHIHCGRCTLTAPLGSIYLTNAYRISPTPHTPHSFEESRIRFPPSYVLLLLLLLLMVVVVYTGHYDAWLCQPVYPEMQAPRLALESANTPLPPFYRFTTYPKNQQNLHRYRRKRGAEGDCGDYTDTSRVSGAFTTQIAAEGAVQATGVRPPSYTDRILAHSLEDRKDFLRRGPYELCDAVRGSDHRPVSQVGAERLGWDGRWKIGKESPSCCYRVLRDSVLFTSLPQIPIPPLPPPPNTPTHDPTIT
jgi:hypothetical protein